VTGQLGVPGSGISPLRGQNNVQGCGDAGCIPTNLPGYQHYEPATLAKFERAWGAAPPPRPGLVVTEMVEGCLDGAVQAMYVVGENPLLSEPDLNHATKAIAQLDCLVSLHGRDKVADWKSLAGRGAWREFVARLLAEHYDPAYGRSSHRNFTRLPEARVVRIASADDAAFFVVASTLLDRAPVTA